MLLDFLIRFHKRKLDRMITEEYNYEKILRQSQRVDRLINLWMKYKQKYKPKM